MFRKKSPSYELFVRKFRILSVFSIIYIIRIRNSRPAGIHSELVREKENEVHRRKYQGLYSCVAMITLVVMTTPHLRPPSYVESSKSLGAIFVSSCGWLLESLLVHASTFKRERELFPLLFSWQWRHLSEPPFQAPAPKRGERGARGLAQRSRDHEVGIKVWRRWVVLSKPTGAFVCVVRVVCSTAQGRVWTLEIRVAYPLGTSFGSAYR